MFFLLKAWDFLLWCDPSNFGGIKSKLPTDANATAAKAKKRSKKNDGSDGGDDGEDNDDEEENEQGKPFVEDSDNEEDDDDDDGSPEIEMNWNLSTYLPEEGACQKNFNTVIAGKR